jgi:hypothetical protein
MGRGEMLLRHDSVTITFSIFPARGRTFSQASKQITFTREIMQGSRGAMQVHSYAAKHILASISVARCHGRNYSEQGNIGTQASEERSQALLRL